MVYMWKVNIYSSYSYDPVISITGIYNMLIYTLVGAGWVSINRLDVYTCIPGKLLVARWLLIVPGVPIVAVHDNDARLVIAYEDIETEEGMRELDSTIQKLTEAIPIKVETIPLSSVAEGSGVTRGDFLYILSVFKTPTLAKAIVEASKREAHILGKLPLEHIAVRAAEAIKGSGCNGVIILYRRAEAVYKETLDDVWRLASLIEHYSGVQATPSTTPELGLDCIMVSTLAKSSLTKIAMDSVEIYGKKLVAESVLSLIGGDLPTIIRKALRASHFII